MRFLSIGSHRYAQKQIMIYQFRSPSHSLHSYYDGNTVTVFAE